MVMIQKGKESVKYSLATHAAEKIIPGMERNRRKRMWFILSAVMGCLVVLLCVILPPSTGKITPVRDADGNIPPCGIAEKAFVEINGTRQGMVIRSADSSKPVLLFLSGGPGIPEYWQAHDYPTGLEKQFTVCYWDYPGTGLSYDAGISAGGLTTERYVDDAIAVTDYLRSRFGQEKIYLMGHSFGTEIGLLAAARAPERYRAYIAVSQIADQLTSEKLAYQTMLEGYRAAGDQKMVKTLAQQAVTEPEESWVVGWFGSSVRDAAMHDFGGGTMHGMKSVITGIFFPTLRCRDYTIAERIAIWRGKKLVSGSPAAVDRMTFCAPKTVPELRIPVYFMAGKYDLTCCYDMQKAYYKQLSAPVKGFYTFENSAHSPLFEEPERAMDIILQDVLNGTVKLSDGGE